MSDPGRISPSDILRSPDYEHVGDFSGNTYPETVQRVMRCKADGTLWAALFAIREDDSDVDLTVSWYPVEKKEIIVTKYVRAGV